MDQITTSQALDQTIEVTPGVAGGKPRIAGHRITVQNVAIWHEWMGNTADEIATEYDLTLADVYATDEHVGRSVVAGLRRRGVDVLTVPEAGMLGASDVEHLKFATSLGRALFTQDDDFLRLHGQGLRHSGIVYAHQQMSISEILRGLMLIYHVMSSADMQDHVEFL